MEIITDLKNHFLVATHKMDGSPFEHAIVYICQYSKQGSMGMIVNHPFPRISFDEIIYDMGIEGRVAEADPIIFKGGPVEYNRGFILHSNDYKDTNTSKVSDRIYLTATSKIVRDIAEGEGPKSTVFCLGYSGWGANQLEEELAANYWNVLPADAELMFNTAPYELFNECNKRLTLNHDAFLSDDIGLA